MRNKTEIKTMIMSILMSAPGPLIIAAGLLVGRSSTQIADFIRRSAELIGLIIAYIVFLATTREENYDIEKKKKLENSSNIFIGLIMCFCGAIMLFVLFAGQQEAQGNVLPSLAIALLGVVANTLFWRKYAKLNKEKPNVIIAVQSRLYRAKSLVDICVSLALLSIVLLPGSALSGQLDFWGTVTVSAYLFWSGVQTIIEHLH